MKPMGIIFSNIYDNALSELTNVRTVASLPFGSRYRQIDFVLSNMSNSGIYNIGIITKYNYRSLMDHLGSCADWDLNRKNESVVILPPFAEGNSNRVYSGKLEALYTARNFMEDSQYDYVVVCDSTILCNIDFRRAIAHHVESGADVTAIACKYDPAEADKGRALVLKANKKNRVVDVLTETTPRPGYYTGMGMFIFGREYLLNVLNETYSKGLIHLERDLLLQRFNQNAINISVYPFDGVVLCNQDIQSYYANNMKLLEKKTRDGLFLDDTPIYTKIRDEAPTYYGEGSRIRDCMIADGCVLHGTVEKSILFRDVKAERGSKIEGSIIMQGARIGKDVQLSNVILDKNVTVREGTVLTGTPEHPVIVQKGAIV